VSRRILVAGIGNIFFGDDGFGVEVARRMACEPLPEGVKVADFGIRALHLAFALLDQPGLLLVVDAVQRGGPPGTIYVVRPDPAAGASPIPDAHAMNLETVIAAVRSLGEEPPPILLVGCEPAFVGEQMRLTAAVERAIPHATALIWRIIAEELGKAAVGAAKESTS